MDIQLPGIKLIKVAIRGNTAEVIRLIDKEGVPVDATNHSGHSALWVIAGGIASASEIDTRHPKYIEIMQALLERGADPEFCNDQGMTVLMRAANYNTEDFVRSFLNTCRILNKSAGIHKSHNQWTALDHAAHHNPDENVLLALIDEGADVNRPCSQYGMTPLRLAAQKGHAGKVTVLLDSGADPYSVLWTDVNGILSNYDRVRDLINARRRFLATPGNRVELLCEPVRPHKPLPESW